MIVLNDQVLSLKMFLKKILVLLRYQGPYNLQCFHRNVQYFHLNSVITMIPQFPAVSCGNVTQMWQTDACLFSPILVDSTVAYFINNFSTTICI